MLQGEREFARDNKLLGTFTLRGIKRAWAGVPKIEVTFDIDANGIVKVKARDMDTGKQQSITISGTSNLTEDEIKRAKENAAAFAGQDKEHKAALEALNAGEPGGRARRRKTRRQPQGPRGDACIRPCPFAVLLNNAFSPLARGIFLCYTTQHSTLMG